MCTQKIGQLSAIAIDSEEHRSACYSLRATQYGRYYRNIPATNFSDEFDTAVPIDEFRVSHLFGVLRSGSVVGTCRLIHSVAPNSMLLKSEVCELFDLQWSHLADLVGVPVQNLSVGELGRFSIAEGEDSREIKWMLLRTSGKHAMSLGIQVVIAIMPPAVERAARNSGTSFHRLEGVKLRRDDDIRKRYLLRHHDYFLPTFSKSGLDIDRQHLESMDSTALDKLLSGVSDGPALWWIRAEDLANSRLPSKNNGDST